MKNILNILLLVGMSINITAFAADAESVGSAGVNVNAVTLGGSGSGLEIPSEIPDLVKGHETQRSVYQYLIYRSNCGLPWSCQTQGFTVPLSVHFNSAGVGEVRFYATLRHNRGLRRITLRPVSVSGSNYMYQGRYSLRGYPYIITVLVGRRTVIVQSSRSPIVISVGRGWRSGLFRTSPSQATDGVVLAWAR